MCWKGTAGRRVFILHDAQGILFYTQRNEGSNCDNCDISLILDNALNRGRGIIERYSLIIDLLGNQSHQLPVLYSISVISLIPLHTSRGIIEPSPVREAL